MKREGNINFEAPLETWNGVPVTFWKLHWWPFSRYKYGCIIHKFKAADQVEWFDKDGFPQRLSVKDYRLMNPRRQSRYEVGTETFWHKAEAIAYATSNGLTEPMEVFEVVTDINGREISRSVLNVGT